MTIRLISIVALSTMAIVACGGSDDNADSNTPPTATSACESLQTLAVPASDIGLPTRGAIIASATLMAKTDTIPEYCRVDGSILSVDFTAQAIHFTAALPSEWNKKLMQLGGGGFDGVILDPAGSTGGGSSGPTAIQRGYAVVADDSGHRSTDGASFALNAEQLDNFAGAHIKKTHDAVVAIIQKRYGSTPAKTYFQGGSGGGRHALLAVQNYPSDYDGVLALYPVMSWTSTFFKFHTINRAMRLNGGAGFLGAVKLRTLRAAELAACDQLDGVNDGIISNVRACSFDPNTLLCPSGTDQGDSCLSQAQVDAVKHMYSSQVLPYALANGNTQIPEFWPGTQWGTTLGTTPTFNNPLDAAGIGGMATLADGFVRYFVMRNPGADALNFDPLAPGAHLQRVQEVSALLDKNDPDISAFTSRGGKLIIVQGMDDQLAAADATIRYYQQVVGKFGQAAVDTSVRFYTIPGYAHFTGAFNVFGGMPTVDALEAWVERGAAPGDLVATDVNPGASRTRPACVFPRWPKYSGTGDVNSAASYQCSSG